MIEQWRLSLFALNLPVLSIIEIWFFALFSGKENKGKSSGDRFVLVPQDNVRHLIIKGI